MPGSTSLYRRWTPTYISGFISFVTLLVLSSEPTCAEWIDIASTEGDAGYTLYVDPDTIRRKENQAKMWVLFDYKLVQRAGAPPILYLSERTQEQFDCAEERLRRLAYTWFSLNMAKGDMVANDVDGSKWQPVAPGTIGLLMWKVACGKQ